MPLLRMITHLHFETQISGTETSNEDSLRPLINKRQLKHKINASFFYLKNY